LYFKISRNTRSYNVMMYDYTSYHLIKKNRYFI